MFARSARPPARQARSQLGRPDEVREQHDRGRPLILAPLSSTRTDGRDALRAAPSARELAHRTGDPLVNNDAPVEPFRRQRLARSTDISSFFRGVVDVAVGVQAAVGDVSLGPVVDVLRVAAGRRRTLFGERLFASWRGPAGAAVVMPVTELESWTVLDDEAFRWRG